MGNYEYALEIFNRRVSSCTDDLDISGKTILELGPGDSVATAIIAASKGATTILIDNGDYACKDPVFYVDLANFIKFDRGSNHLHNFDSILAACNQSKYFTRGLDSLRQIQSKSIDFIFSNAVLEHVARSEFHQTIEELSRILKPGCMMSHEIDFRDHLGGLKNNMRFPHSVWESPFIKKSGCYTNRLTCSEILSVFHTCGFSIIKQELTMHPVCPDRNKLHGSFSHISDFDLNVAVGSFVFVLCAT